MWLCSSHLFHAHNFSLPHCLWCDSLANCYEIKREAGELKPLKNTKEPRIPLGEGCGREHSGVSSSQRYFMLAGKKVFFVWHEEEPKWQFQAVWTNTTGGLLCAGYYIYWQNMQHYRWQITTHSSLGSTIFILLTNTPFESRWKYVLARKNGGSPKRSLVLRAMECT